MNIATAFVEIRSKSDRGKAEVRNDAKAMAQEATKMFAEYFSAKMVVDEFSKVIKSAARLEQAVGGTEAIFGKFARSVDAAAKTSAKSMGLSEAAFREVTSQIGGLLNGLGFTQEEAARTSVSLAQLGADLAATFGGNPEEAVQALGAALRGEFDPLERFGVSLRQQEINLKAVEMGLAKTTSTVDANSRAQAALALIMEQSTQAQGQFAREQDTASGKAATFSAELENMRAKLGAQLLPTFVAAVDLLSLLLDGFSALPGPVQVAVVALVSVVALAAPLMRTAAAIKAITIGLAGANPYFLAAGVAIAVLAGVVVAFTGKVSESEERIKSMADAMDEAGDAAAGLTLYLKGLLDENDFLVDVLDKAGVTIQEVADAALRGGKSWNDMALDIAKASRTMESSEEQQESLRQFIVSLPGDVDAAVERMEAFDRVTGDVGTSSRGAAPGVRALNDEVEETAKVTIQATSAFDELDAAVSRLSEAFDNIIGRSLDLESAQVALYEGAEAITESFKENGRTLDIATAKGRANRDAIASQVDAILAMAAAQVQNGASNEEAAAAVMANRDALVTQLEMLGLTRDAAEDYIDQLGLTPDNVTTSIEVANVEAAKARVQSQLDKLGELPVSKATFIQALIDQGKWQEAENALNQLARAREVEFRARMIAAGPTSPYNNNPTRNAAGGYFMGTQTIAVGDGGDEAVLPLRRPSRLAQLLDDPRIGGPVRDALGPSMGDTAARMGPMVSTGDIYVSDTRSMREELEYMAWAAGAR